MKNMTGTILMVLGASLFGVGAYVQFKPQAAIAKEVESPRAVVQPEVTITKEVKDSRTVVQPETPKQTKHSDDTPQQKGYAFEKYIVSSFNKKYFSVVRWTGDKYVDGQYDPSNMDPDIVLKLTARGETHSFAVECKWRSHFTNGVVKVATNDQLKRYFNYGKEKNLPTFVAVGVGGTPANPKHLYMVPIHRLRYGNAKKSYLEEFEVEADGKLYYDVEKGRFK